MQDGGITLMMFCVFTLSIRQGNKADDKNRNARDPGPYHRALIKAFLVKSRFFNPVRNLTFEKTSFVLFPFRWLTISIPSGRQNFFRYC